MGKKHSSSSISIPVDQVYQIWGWIFLVWSFYRYFARFPEWVDELIFKPTLFIFPVVWWVRSIAKQPFSVLGITTKNIRGSALVGLGIGCLFLLAGYIGKLLRPAGVQFMPIAIAQQYSILGVILLSFATAVSEEVLNRGFLFHLVAIKTKQFIRSFLVASTLSVLLHVPILVSSLKFGGASLVIFFITELTLGLINNFLINKYSSLMPVILTHVLWNITVFYYL